MSPAAQSILTLVGSTLILQANGVFVGLRMRPGPALRPRSHDLRGAGAVLAIYEILGAFEEAEKVQRFVQKAEAAIKKYPILSRYGAVTLMILPAMPIVGLYTSVPIGWLFRWNKAVCIFFITLGWILVVLFLMFLSLGVIHGAYLKGVLREPAGKPGSRLTSRKKGEGDSLLGLPRERR